MNITVYLGSSMGNNPKYSKIAEDLGHWIGANSHTLVYGGSKVGMMGVLADSVLESGGKAIGIEIEKYYNSQLQNENLTELHICKTLSERKQMMTDIGDVFIALPGGVGTLDEICGAMALVSTGIQFSPCIFYNLDGYYDMIKRQLDVMDEEGFLGGRDLSNVHFISCIEELDRICKQFSENSH